jgi:hypothetical protein
VLWGSNHSRYLSSAKLNVKVPDYCPEHVPLHESFVDEQSLAPLLAEIEAKDSQLQDLVDSGRITSQQAAFEESTNVDEDEERDTFNESYVQQKLPPRELQRFQDFVSSFLSVFLRSKFLKSTRGIDHEHDPADLVLKLATNRHCPEMPLFRRVAVDPKLLGAAIPDDDNPGFVESGVAVNQLARLLDIAVLQFLSTVNEHTDVDAILWALDYMKNLLGSLISSMNSLNSFGWYGAPHMRIRKGTAVRKSSYLLQPPFLNPPPLVVVGTPPISPNRSPEHVLPPQPPLGRVEEKRDPVTGQEISPTFSPRGTISPRANRSPPSLWPNTQVGGAEASPTLSPGLGVVGQSGSGMEWGSRHSATVSGGEGRQRQRRVSREEPRGILKAPSLDSAFGSPTHSPSSPRSPGLQGHGAAPPVERKRKVTPASMPPRPPAGGSNLGMGSIQEEDDVDNDPRGLGVAIHHLSMLAGSMGSIAEEEEEEEEKTAERGRVFTTESERMFSMDSVEKDYFKSMEDEIGAPVPRLPNSVTPVSPLEVAKAHSPQSPVWSAEGPNPPRANDREVSPLVFGSPPDLSPSPSPLRSPGPTTSRPRSMRSASLSPPPPLPKNTPEVNVDMELQTLMNGEGRISLLALLHAIAHFPQSDEIWKGEVGERCFSLIQLCMDIGMPPQTDDSPKPAASGLERRKRFHKQDNKAFNKLSPAVEKPWKVHGRFTVKFAVEALIQCGTCSIVGCTMDSTFCRLKHYHVTPSHGTATHNRLIRILRRIHLHSPSVFRQALIEFSQPSKSSCRRLFQFLHVVLQYCIHGGGEVGFNHLLASVVMSVMSVTVDRLVQLDITEPSIQDVS